MVTTALARGEARNRQALCLWQTMRDCASAGDEAGCQSARRQLFELYEHLSFQIARQQLRNAAYSRADLEQECRLATVLAIDAWEPARGDLLILLNYLVCRRVRRFIQRSELIRRPESLFERYWRNWQAGTPDADSAPLPVVSLDEPPPDTHDALPECYADPAAGQEYERFILQTAVQEALTHLADEERLCVELHFGIGGGEPQGCREIAPLIGRSHSTVANRIKSALPVLAQALEGYA